MIYLYRSLHPFARTFRSVRSGVFRCNCCCLHLSNSQKFEYFLGSFFLSPTPSVWAHDINWLFVVVFAKFYLFLLSANGSTRQKHHTLKNVGAKIPASFFSWGRSEKPHKHSQILTIWKWECTQIYSYAIKYVHECDWLGFYVVV